LYAENEGSTFCPKP